MYLQKDFSTNIHSSFVYNCQILGEPKSPSPSKWVNKIWYSHRKECHSAMKRTELHNINESQNQKHAECKKTYYSNPLVSTGNWFQYWRRIPKSMDAQVPHLGLCIHGPESMDPINHRLCTASYTHFKNKKKI